MLLTNRPMTPLEAITTYKSRNVVETAFRDLYVVRASRGVIGRFVKSTKMPSRPLVIVLTACSTASSRLANASGKR